MENLRINLFGTIELRFKNKALFVFPTKKCEAILVYLVLAHGNRIQREAIVAEFWQQLPPRCGRRALNTDIWRLRNLLRQSGLEPQKVFSVTNETLAFKPTLRCSVDVFDFEDGLYRLSEFDPCVAEPDQIEMIEGCLHLYRGDLFEGCYDDWCVVSREALRAKRFEALEFLLQYYLHHQSPSKALSLAKQLLALDPLMEHIHRAIMYCYSAMGNRPAAIVHYENCARLLKKELGIDPMPETERLHRSIMLGLNDISLGAAPISARPVPNHAFNASSL